MSICEYAIGQFEIDLSVPSALREVLKDPEAEFIYLIEAKPYNDQQENTIIGSPPLCSVAWGQFDYTVTGGLETVYVSDVGYYTNGGDTPAHTSYLPLTNNPFQFDASILSGDQFSGGSPSFGAIRILNGDDELDELAQTASANAQ